MWNILNTRLTLSDHLRCVSNLLHLGGGGERCEELLGVGLVLGVVEEGLLGLGLGQEPEVQSVEAEPVRDPDPVVLMSLGL